MPDSASAEANDLDLDLLVWGGDVTPAITCGECEATLVAYSNGNAPLDFTARELLAAIRAHTCDPASVKRDER